jgi:putative transposase
MSIPRPVVPGQSYMITRRCTQRQFLMRPDGQTNNAFVYCLAEAAARFRVEVLFTVAMSNHHHTGIYDPEGNYPAFIEHFHKLFAKCQNSLRGRWENFWSSEQTSVVRLVDPNDAVDKLLYAITNPVKDGLVERAHHWPGVSSVFAVLHGSELSATRPKHFFREGGRMPASVTLRFSRVRGFERLSDSELRRFILERVRQIEESAAADRRQRGASIVGRKGVLAQRWRDCPPSREPRRALNPRVAARSKWSRIEALLRNRAFRDAYARARAGFLAGVRDAIFPAGTYWLRRFANAVCEPLSSPG